jgi:outer membrane lipoprotein SlyB
MKNSHYFEVIVGLAIALGLGACANSPAPANQSSSGEIYAPYGNSSNVYPRYGIVQSIDLVQISSSGTGDGRNVGAGTVAGAVVGGIIGNQIGSGDGRTAATILGAAGGAYAGHALEKGSQQTTDAFKFTVLMEDRSYVTTTQTTNGDIRVGDRVQLDNGVMRRY